MKEKQKKKYKFQCISGFHCVKNAIFITLDSLIRFRSAQPVLRPRAIFSIFQGTFSCHLFDFPLLLQQIFSIY